jgi:hypothetical protein
MLFSIQENLAIFEQNRASDSLQISLGTVTKPSIQIFGNSIHHWGLFEGIDAPKLVGLFLYSPNCASFALHP